ncbi:copper resistance protein CopC [Streptosporangium lutulentum]
MFHRQPVARLIALAAIAACALSAMTGTASAHTTLKSSDPADGATVKKPPADIELVFTENISRNLATVVVTGPGGEKVVDGKPKIKGATLTQPLTDDLVNGRYTIAFRVVSADGHPISKELRFTLKAPKPSPTPTPTPTPTPAPTQGSASPAAPQPCPRRRPPRCPTTIRATGRARRPYWSSAPCSWWSPG